MATTLVDVLALAERMASFSHPWWIAGGWVIDVWLGVATREHDDLEIGILRGDQLALRRHLADWLVERVVGEGAEARWEGLAADEYVDAPEFQLRFHRAGADPMFEVFLNDVLNEVDQSEWVSRRHPTVRVGLDALVVRSALGLPVLAPEVQLLYKAKYHRPKDEHDFQRARSRLSDQQTSWLRHTLEEYHPNDPWLSLLQGPAAVTRRRAGR